MARFMLLTISGLLMLAIIRLLVLVPETHTQVLPAVALATGSVDAVDPLTHRFPKVEIKKKPLREIAVQNLFAQHSQEDVLWLTRNLYHEARGEGHSGMVAVAWVTVNRATSGRFPKNIAAVVQQGGEARNKCQFSWRCDGKSDEPRDMATWREAQRIAKEVLSGKIADNTGGSLFYYNPSLATPCWGESGSDSREIGNHRFIGDIPWKEMQKLCVPGRHAGLLFFTSHA